MNKKNKGLQKFFSVFTTVTFLVNSFLTPFSIIAQEISPTAEPTAVVQQVQEPTPEPTTVSTETITPIPEVTVVPTETPVSTPLRPSDSEGQAETVTSSPEANQPSEQPQPSQSTDTQNSAEPTIVPTPSPEPNVTAEVTTVVEPEKDCFNNESVYKETSYTDWTFNEQTQIYETKENVQLGVRYAFPLENKVSVTFKCLPKDESLLTPLKIQQVKVADLKLPVDVKTNSEYAYDITTGMTDGTFEYDITLPKPENSTAEISYIEKTAEELKTIQATVDEVKQIDESQIGQEGTTVKASGIDHFTIFVPMTFSITSIPSLPNCFNDSDGPNDKPGQKDLTKLCQDLSSVDPLEITWNWDVIEMSGSNTADACALFDTNNNGNANYAMCVSWEKVRQQLPVSPRLYSCSDTRPDRCTGSSLITISHGSTCVVDLDATGDPFPSGDSSPKDAIAYCSIYLDDVGGVAKARSLDVCSYPSEQPNSDPSDCVLISENKGNLEISKDVVPDNSNTNWNISVSGLTSFTDTLTGDDTTGIKAVLPGIYTVSESAGSGTNLSDYNSSWSCSTDGGTPQTGTGTTINSLSVAKDSIVNCVFTNQLKAGTVVVHKDVQGPNGEDTTDTSQNFTVRLDGNNAKTLTDSGTVTYANVSSGTHTITEDNPPAGYTFYSITPDSDSGTPGAQITVNAGQTTDVYIINKQQQTTLKLVKTVINNSGGTKQISDFVLKIDGNQVTSGVANIVTSSSHTASEVNLSGYTASDWEGDCASDGTINLALGDNKTCTITNDDQVATLIVKKILVKDNGGTKAVADFSFKVNGGSSQAFESDAQNDLTVNAGTYSVVEDAVSGYTTTYDNCTAVVIPNGGTATCTITNDDQVGTLMVIKHVVNSNGGTKEADDFNITVTGGSPSPATFDGVESPGTTVTLNAGSYSVDEVAVSGYLKSLGTDCSGTIANGETKTCTVTNNDIAPTLTLVKTVINNNGGNEGGEDWVLYADGSDRPFYDWGPVVGPNQVMAGVEYTLTETDKPGYSASSWVCTGGGTQTGNKITLALDEDVTCTITNDDVAPKLTLVKTVTNDNGGNKVVADFPLFIDGVAATSGVAYDVDANKQITVSETTQTGYAPTTWGGNCSTDGKITLLPGDNKTCTITNDDQPATLTLVKHLPNDNGGTATQNDFNVYIDNVASTWGSHQINAGTYTVKEDALSGYGPSAWSNGCAANGVVSLVPGQSKTCEITNDDISAKISGYKWEDVNANGVWDAGETAQSGWQIFIDENKSYGLDAGDTTTITNASGYYEFAVLPGEHWVFETQQAGWSQQVPYYTLGHSYFIINITAGQTYSDNNFGNYRLAHIEGDKWNDLDGDGVQDAGEPNILLSGLRYRVYKEVSPGVYSEVINGPFESSHYGEYVWVAPGTYWVTEYNIPTGWTQTHPDSNAPTAWGMRLLGPITVLSGDTSSGNNLGNTQLSSIHGYKWNDADASGGPTNGLGEELLSGWTINLYKWNGEAKAYDSTPIKTMITDNGTKHFGWYWFEDLLPGQYKVCEELQIGWIQTYPINQDNDCHVVNLPDDNSGGLPEGLNYVSGPEYNFGNQFVNPKLLISKSNNAVGDKTPGGSVTYTITVTATDSAVLGAKVRDLLPAGFVYRSGSWTAVSNINSGLTVLEPVYASPGNWNLGDMKAGEVITLTYVADISNDQQPGLFKDLAWTAGISLSDNRVIGNDDTGIFVGTDVNVVKEQQESTSLKVEKEEGQVLGASTGLPATGATTLWSILASIILALGSLLVLLGVFMKKNNRRLITKVFGSLLVILTFVLISGKVQANFVNYLSIRLEQPKTPTNQNTFNITFVSLDLLDREITVKCFKKGPADVSFTQFGSDIALAAGGNTGNCVVDSTIVSDKGTYQFYANATVPGGALKDSPIVTVDYNKTEGPGTPSGYSKDRITNCEYKITFTTSNDSGKTTKVEIYRSDKTEFNLDSGNRVGIITIGSNQSATFNDVVPDCNKDYYYAIRAFDTYGNGSGVVGDSVINVTTTTTTTVTSPTTGAIPVEGITLPAEISPTTAAAEVLGLSTPSAEVKTYGLSGIKKVLGAVTSKKNLPITVVIGLVILGIIAYVIFRKKQKKIA